MMRWRDGLREALLVGLFVLLVGGMIGGWLGIKAWNDYMAALPR